MARQRRARSFPDEFSQEEQLKKADGGGQEAFRRNLSVTDAAEDMKRSIGANTQERCILLGVSGTYRDEDEAQASMEELAELAETAGAEVVGFCFQQRQVPDSKTFVGQGKAQELQQRVREEAVGLVVADEELSAGQVRGLQALLGCRVIDRSLLILDIFAQRAMSREGKLQVELAQLSLLKGRLQAVASSYSRQGGGIGTRGPGETLLETERRRIQLRLDQLRRELDEVMQVRQTQSRRRERARDLPIVALAGYTNVGKSTLLNALTADETYVQNQLFATLDSRLSHLPLAPSGNALLMDTVGFIRRLPHELIAAFRSSLEPLVEADLLCLVLDASDPEIAHKTEVIEQLLVDMKAGDRPRIYVFNKADLHPAPEAQLLQRRKEAQGERCCRVAAATGLGLDELRACLATTLWGPLGRCLLRLPYSDLGFLERCYRENWVELRRDLEDGVELELYLPRRKAEAQLQGRDWRWL